MVRTVLVTALLAACSKRAASPPPPPPPDAAPPPDASDRVSAGEVTALAYPDLAAALEATIPADARVVGFGELHARTDRGPIKSALAAFTEVLPTFAGRLSDLVVGTAGEGRHSEARDHRRPPRRDEVRDRAPGRCGARRSGPAPRDDDRLQGL
jgi:hypothetical protein